MHAWRVALTRSCVSQTAERTDRDMLKWTFEGTHTPSTPHSATCRATCRFEYSVFSADTVWPSPCLSLCPSPCSSSSLPSSPPWLICYRDATMHAVCCVAVPPVVSHPHCASCLGSDDGHAWTTLHREATARAATDPFPIPLWRMPCPVPLAPVHAQPRPWRVPLGSVPYDDRPSQPAPLVWGGQRAVPARRSQILPSVPHSASG